MYNIKLADGTELANLELNGNNFISNTIVGDVFKDNLDTVTITDENGSVEYKNMKLVQNKIYNNQSWFILAEKTRAELEKEEHDAIIAGLSYELVAKDLSIQSLEQTQAETLYQLMAKGVL